MKRRSLIANDVADALHVLAKSDQDYVINFSKKFLRPLPVIRRLLRLDTFAGLTKDKHKAYLHQSGNLYILFSEFTYNGDLTQVIFDVFKRELVSVKSYPGDHNEKIISKVSH